jgi:hypothetical protein
MKGVVFLGDRKLELREFPDPTPGPRDGKTCRCSGHSVKPPTLLGL